MSGERVLVIGTSGKSDLVKKLGELIPQHSPFQLSIIHDTKLHTEIITGISVEQLRLLCPTFPFSQPSPKSLVPLEMIPQNRLKYQ